MNPAITLTPEVLATQLRQIVSQIDQLSSETWKVKGIPTDGAATITTRLDDARHAVWMAAVRAEVEIRLRAKTLPVCERDGQESDGDDRERHMPNNDDAMRHDMPLSTPRNPL